MTDWMRPNICDPACLHVKNQGQTIKCSQVRELKQNKQVLRPRDQLNTATSLSEGVELLCGTPLTSLITLTMFVDMSGWSW